MFNSIVCVTFFALQKFCDHEAFEEIKRRAIFVHVDVPGHEDGAEDMPEGTFPTIQQVNGTIGRMMVYNQ